LAAQIVEDRRRRQAGFDPLLERTKITPKLGALVKVAPSKPANMTVLATPGRDSRMSDASRTTRSVRSRLDPGGKENTAMK
jgi:hypothetical protein